MRAFNWRIDAGQIALLIILLSVIASFVIGDLLGENSVGSSRPDFYEFYWKDIQLFSEVSWDKAIINYSSATNPLLFMIAGMLPLHGNQKIYHLITFVAGLSVWPLLSLAYYRRYAKHGINFLWASFGASAILLSPCFRSSAFWRATDYLPFVFCAITSLLLSKFQDCECEKARAINVSTLIALAAVSACAFYVRQYYLFVPIIVAWTILIRTKTPPLAVLVVFSVAMIPELSLIYLWKGLNPPAAHGYFSSGSDQFVGGRSHHRLVINSACCWLYPTVVRGRPPGLVGNTFHRCSLCRIVGVHYCAGQY